MAPVGSFPLLFSNAWLRSKIAMDPDDEPMAGGPVTMADWTRVPPPRGTESDIAVIDAATDAYRERWLQFSGSYMAAHYRAVALADAIAAIRNLGHTAGDAERWCAAALRRPAKVKKVVA